MCIRDRGDTATIASRFEMSGGEIIVSSGVLRVNSGTNDVSFAGGSITLSDLPGLAEFQVASGDVVFDGLTAIDAVGVYRPGVLRLLEVAAELTRRTGVQLLCRSRLEELAERAGYIHGFKAMIDAFIRRRAAAVSDGACLDYAVGSASAGR